MSYLTGSTRNGRSLVAFCRIAGPLQQRLSTMGGSTNRRIAAVLQNQAANRDTLQLARSVCEAHDEAEALHESFTPAERQTTDRLAPRGNTVFSARDHTSLVDDLPPTIENEEVPGLAKSIAAPKGVRFIASRIRKLTKWRHFFTYMQGHQRGTNQSC
jgi:hypothetical protein